MNGNKDEREASLRDFLYAFCFIWLIVALQRFFFFESYVASRLFWLGELIFWFGVPGALLEFIVKRYRIRRKEDKHDGDQ